jgi:hypothetical protein
MSGGAKRLTALQGGRPWSWLSTGGAGERGEGQGRGGTAVSRTDLNEACEGLHASISGTSTHKRVKRIETTTRGAGGGRGRHSEGCQSGAWAVLCRTIVRWRKRLPG